MLFETLTTSIETCFIDISSKASSYRLLAGTNEFAEDLTGQRMPLNASQWKSETKVKCASLTNGERIKDLKLEY